MSNKILLDDSEQDRLVHYITQAIADQAKEVASGIAHPDGYLFQAIVDAVYNGVKDGTKEAMEERK